ncbi:MAG: cyclic nucleotide-binding domain-containing protein [Sphingomonadales bacterium]|nr:cyclic nucleotide-binding domain-containing protein [Sphingomonadales bacterium]
MIAFVHFDEQYVSGAASGPVIDVLLGKGQVKSFAKGAVVYRRGDPGESLMMVIHGRIKLTNTTIHGKEIVLYYVGPGEILGEIAALDGKERAVDTSRWKIRRSLSSTRAIFCRP